MRALVKPSEEPYEEIMLESSWGRWIRSHLPAMIEAGWTLIEEYIPPAPPTPPEE
jgi:hypothetical protein